MRWRYPLGSALGLRSRRLSGSSSPSRHTAFSTRRRPSLAPADISSAHSTRDQPQRDMEAWLTINLRHGVGSAGRPEIVTNPDIPIHAWTPSRAAPTAAPTPPRAPPRSTSATAMSPFRATRVSISPITRAASLCPSSANATPRLLLAMAAALRGWQRRVAAPGIKTKIRRFT